MKLTLSVIKADIGSIGGYIAPSRRLLGAVGVHLREHGRGLLLDHHIGHTGDDIAILMTRTRGTGDEQVHRLAWDAFVSGITQKLDQLGGRFKVRHAAQRCSDVGPQHNSAIQMDETRREEEHVSSPA